MNPFGRYAYKTTKWTQNIIALLCLMGENVGGETIFWGNDVISTK